jgi:hypothetical protein
MNAKRAKEIRRAAKYLNDSSSNPAQEETRYSIVKGTAGRYVMGTVILDRCLRYLSQNIKKDFKKRIFTINFNKA